MDVGILVYFIVENIDKIKIYNCDNENRKFGNPRLSSYLKTILKVRCHMNKLIIVLIISIELFN